VVSKTLPEKPGKIAEWPNNSSESQTQM